MTTHAVGSSRQRLVHVIGICLGVIALSAAVPARAYMGENLAKSATVSLKQARQIALSAHPGVIVDQELEKEPGGRGLRYSFDVRAGKVTQEVGVDAMTGHVLENQPEGAHPD